MYSIKRTGTNWLIKSRKERGHTKRPKEQNTNGRRKETKDKRMATKRQKEKKEKKEEKGKRNAEKRGRSE